jgi:predicted dehydrogenase
VSDIAVALVGLGEHTRLRLLPALERLAAVRLVGGVDPDPGARRRLGSDTPALMTVATLDELAERATVDAVVVAASPEAAPAVAEEALGRGWAVYLEKPGAIGRAWLPAVGKDGPTVVPGLCYRHDPAVREVAAAVRRGDVGRLVAARFVFTSPSRPAGWRADPARGGGVLRDLAIHDLDLARVFTGEQPEPVVAHLGSRHTDQDTASVALTTPSGTALQLLAAQGAAETSTFEVLGEEGRLVVDRWSAPWVVRRGRRAVGPGRTAVGAATLLARPAGWRAARAARLPGVTQERALAAFVARVRAQPSDAPVLDDLASALEVVEACERIAISGGRVVPG